MLAGLLVLLLLTGSGGAEITVVVPNPSASNDVGEYLVVSFPRETNLAGWAVTDGESTASLPNQTVSGTVAITTDPAAVRNTTDHRVLGLRGWLALANTGERIHLLRNGLSVDTVEFARVPEGHHYVRTDDEWRWVRPGATDLPVVTTGGGMVQAFVLPDTPEPPLTALTHAQDRILLAGYTFRSSRVVAALCSARGRGVTVKVLIERGPVGGMTHRGASLLDDLIACDVTVKVIGGDHGRYSFHHAKYAVIDDQGLVLTENWTPTGTGGRSSRGWGVIVADPDVAAALAHVYTADAGWNDASNWSKVRASVTPHAGDQPVPAGYPSRFSARQVRVDRVDVLVAPDNAESAMLDLIAAANTSIRIQQVTIGSRNHPFLQAALDAARRGITVQVLLSGAWYVREDNAALVTWLRGYAARADLSVDARIVEPRGRFEKTHVKGIIVDDDRVAIGSMNWNNHSVRQNRETVLVLYGDAIGTYYAEVFRSDWQGGAWRLPAGLIATTIVILIIGQRVGRRTISFHPHDPRDHRRRIMP